MRNALAKTLKSLGACSSSVEYVTGKTRQQAWDECEDAGWMGWLIARVAGKPDSTAYKRMVFVFDKLGLEAGDNYSPINVWSAAHYTTPDRIRAYYPKPPRQKHEHLRIF